MNIDPRLNEIDDCLYRVSVKAIVLDADKTHILVCKEFKDWWDFPGGGVDHGESPEAALLREIGEELTLPADTKITINNSVAFTASGIGSKNIPKINLFYLVKLDTDQIGHTKELSEIKWLNLSEINSTHWKPSLGDPQTLAENLGLVIRK